MPHPDRDDILASAASPATPGRGARPRSGSHSVRVALATIGVAGVAAFAVASGAATLAAPAARPAPVPRVNEVVFYDGRWGGLDALERRNLASLQDGRWGGPDAWEHRPPVAEHPGRRHNPDARHRP